MNEPTVMVADRAAVERGGPALDVCQVRFVADAPPNAIVLRRYLQPRLCFAVETALDSQNLPAQSQEPEPTDNLTVILIPASEAKGSAKELAERWMTRPPRAEAVATVEVNHRSNRIQWRPGRALVQGPPEGFPSALAALADFAFYEGELRQLEDDLASREVQAQADALRAHRIRLRDRKHWSRFGESIEQFYRMRLNYARLQPHLASASRALGPDARSIMKRLLREADMDTRLEALSNRLEVCEDLYEGANDRVSDFRWYVASQWLEVTIIVLLLIEIAILATEFYSRHAH